MPGWPAGRFEAPSSKVFAATLVEPLQPMAAAWPVELGSALQ
jgi:hypothetical protein